MISINIPLFWALDAWIVMPTVTIYATCPCVWKSIDRRAAYNVFPFYPFYFSSLSISTKCVLYWRQFCDHVIKNEKEIKFTMLCVLYNEWGVWCYLCDLITIIVCFTVYIWMWSGVRYPDYSDRTSLLNLSQFKLHSSSVQFTCFVYSICYVYIF